MAPKGPYRLVTVNTAPERAALIVGRMIERLADQYAIEHAANCKSIDEVGEKVRELKPDLVFCASMWTEDEAARIQSIAKSMRPQVKTHAIPRGLQAERGPDGVVEYLLEKVPPLLEA